MRIRGIGSLVLLALLLIVDFRSSPLPAQTTLADDPVVYPLARRFRISSLFDHSNPSYTRDGIITIHTGDTVSDDPNDPYDQAQSGTVWGYTDYDTDLRDLRWDDFSPGWLWYDGHPAYDLTSPYGTSVAAANSGTAYRWGTTDLYIDHGGGYQTWYLHLSQRIDSETYVYPGTEIGESGTAGTGPHLHFEVRRYGARIDPFGWEGQGQDPWPYNVGNIWVSGDPVPMGYRDQDGTVHGPHALDNTKIRQKWLDLNGKPGSPVEHDWTSTCVPEGTGLLATLHIQGFERGYIQYCGSGSAEYVEYAKTYLPDIRAHEDANEWNSTIVIRNNASGITTVNITFYDQDGHVLDSRTHKSAPKRGIWTVDVRSALIDFLTQAGYEASFTGSAVVSADQDVSVVVENRNVGAQMADAYNGVAPPGAPGNPGFGNAGSTLYLPTIMHDWYGWNSEIVLQNLGTQTANVSVEYYAGLLGDTYRGNDHCCSEVSIPPGGQAVIPQAPIDELGQFLGSAIVTSTNNQPLAGVVNETDGSMLFTYNAFSDRSSTAYLPSILYQHYSYNTSLQIQNTCPHDIRVYITYTADNQHTWPPWMRNTSFTVDHIISGYSSITRHEGVTQYSDIYGHDYDRFFGSARVMVQYGYSCIASTVNQQSYDCVVGMDYNGLPDGNWRAVLPVVMRKVDGWSTSVNIQNLSSGQNEVDIFYYNLDGIPAGQQDFKTIEPYGVVNLYHKTDDEHLPEGFQGSAVIQSRSPYQRIAVMANPSRDIRVNDQEVPDKDLAESYNAFNW